MLRFVFSIVSIVYVDIHMGACCHLWDFPRNVEDFLKSPVD